MKYHWEKQMKDGLGDLNRSPERDLWPQIERELNKRDKKRAKIIPLWWKSGAIVATAASLALILLLNPTQEKDVQIAVNPVTQKDNTTTQKEKSSELNNTPEQEAQEINSSPVVAAIGLDETNDSASEPDFMSETSEPIADNVSSITSAHTGQNQQIASRTKPQSKSVETSDKRSGENNLLITEHTAVATNTEPHSVIDSQQHGKTTAQGRHPLVNQNSSKIAITGTESVKVSETTSSDGTQIVETSTESVTSLVAEQDQSQDIKEKTKNQTWSVMPVVGPVYYNSLTQGSVFDPSFSDNKRQGDVTFSYGLRVNIAFDDKLVLRAGINSVAMGYTTQDVEIATGPASFGLSSVSYNDTRNVISVFDKGTLPANPSPDPTNPYNQLNLKSSSGETTLRANLNYLEFPVELSYALIDQKVKLSVISGVSGLILNNNEVSVNDGQNRYVLGGLNNLSELSFSTNLGLGLRYKVFNGFNLQFEPTFKYQLGTFKDASVDFTPYQLVLLSGLQFQF